MRVGSGLFLVLAALASLWSNPALAAKPVVGKPAPDFQVVTYEGKLMKLSDFKGQVVILNFWATWCGPCKAELPLLSGYYKARQDIGLRVLAVATEDSVPESALRPLQKVVGFPMIRRILGPYRVMDGVPTNYVIDRAGVLRYAGAGAFTLDSLNDLLVPLLNEAPPADPPPASVTQAAPQLVAKNP